jgi:hypothetical protein
MEKRIRKRSIVSDTNSVLRKSSCREYGDICGATVVWENV